MFASLGRARMISSARMFASRLRELTIKAMPLAVAGGVGLMCVQNLTTEAPERSQRTSALSAALKSSHEKRGHSEASEEQTVAVDPIPVHLTIGSRVEHPKRGLGTVVKVDPSPLTRVFVAFDEGDTHGYLQKAWHKLTPSEGTVAPLALLAADESCASGMSQARREALTAASKAAKGADQRLMVKLRALSWIHSRHVDDICTMLNAVIDLNAGFSEEVEQHIFRRAVLTICEHLEKLLPEPYLMLCFEHAWEEGIQPTEAEGLASRLTSALHDNHLAQALPYLPPHE